MNFDRCSMSGPEEGDLVDDTILIIDDDGTELIEIREGALAKRKSLGQRIAKLMNEANAYIIEGNLP